LLSKDLALWPEDKQVISTKDLGDAFLTFTHLPMLSSTDTLRETIIQGVAEGTFAYARGSAEKGEFHVIKIGSSLEREAIEFTGEAYLLRPKFARQLLGTIKGPPEGEEEGEAGVSTAPPPPPGLETYISVTVSADLDWKKWAKFSQLVNGAEGLERDPVYPLRYPAVSVSRPLMYVVVSSLPVLVKPPRVCLGQGLHS